MLRKHMAACLTATAFLAGPALAQTSGAPAQGSPPAQQSASQAASGKFITQQSPNHWRSSQLVGLAVYSANNERIGDINEVLIDRNGMAEAIVIGVGGFLGIGEKDVAVPFKSVEWRTGDANRTAANTGDANRTAANTGDANRTAAGAGTASAPTGPANTASGAPNTNSGPGTGTTGTTTSTAGPGADGSRTAANQPGGSSANTTGSTSGTAADRSTGTSGANRGGPEAAVVRMSKADLENAPTFRYAGSTDAGSSGNAPARTGTGSGANAPTSGAPTQRP